METIVVSTGITHVQFTLSTDPLASGRDTRRFPQPGGFGTPRQVRWQEQRARVREGER